MKKSFEEWFKELVDFAESTNDGGQYVLDTKDGWRDYYEYEYSPEEAYREDMSYE